MASQSILRDPDLPIGADERQIVGTQLQGMLVDLVDLALMGKQAHWTVEGPQFTSLHRQLDELVDAWREFGDEVAERAIAIGVIPDGQAETVVETTKIEPLPTAPLHDGALVEALAERIAAVAARARERMQDAALRDPVTEDLLIQVVASLEKQAWMIRVQREHA